MKLLTLTATANVKHSPTPSQIDIDPHTKDLFTSVVITQYKMISFQQKKLQRMPKGKEKNTSEKIKHISQLAPDVT